jgi:Mg2+/Co2+ transporter CorB
LTIYRGTYNSSAARRRRSFHRLGITVAAAVMAIGLAIIAAAVVRLELWEALHEDSLAIVLSMVLAPLAVVCFAVYGVVRAIGWVFGGSVG